MYIYICIYTLCIYTYRYILKGQTGSQTRKFTGTYAKELWRHVCMKTYLYVRFALGSIHTLIFCTCMRVGGLPSPDVYVYLTSTFT